MTAPQEPRWSGRHAPSPGLIVALFVLGFLAIVFEHTLKVNKSASALLAGVACWAAYVAHGDARTVEAHLVHHMGQLSQILFFLLGAMTIVELIDAHDGFDLITSRVRARSRRKLLVSVAAFSFVLSAVLDNLTTAIVMMSLSRKLTCDERDRMYFGSIVIIAANAGGAWSPIGDVTTTMLWIGGQLTTPTLVTHVLLPSVVNVVVPLAWIASRMHGCVERVDTPPVGSTSFEGKIVFVAGVGVLLFVPVFKAITQLPPFMGILLGVGLLWALTEIIHRNKDHHVRRARSVAAALQRIDTPSIMFFLGILLAISALQSAGTLARLGTHLQALGDVDLITLTIGLASALIDNVPLVAAAQGMYPLETFPQDHHFWIFLAYCAGTGGSILIIGSAAGIAMMGMQRIRFGWYLRRISLPALLGYVAGALTYLWLA